MKEQLIQIQHRAVQYWQARNRREQLILKCGGVLLLLAIYCLTLQTVQSRISGLQKRLPELTLNSYEIAAGKHSAAAAPQKHAEDLRSELFRILADQGLQAELRGLSAERVEMHLTGRAGQSLIASLNALRLAAGARISTLQIRALEEPGQVDATVIMERRQ